MIPIAIIDSLVLGCDIDVSAFTNKLSEVAAKIAEQFDISKTLAMGIAKVEKSLAKEAETFGLASDEAAVHRLKLQGVSEAALANVRALQLHNQGLKVQENLMNRGKDLFEQTRKPIEKYRDELAKLKVMLNNGAVSQDTYNRALKELKNPNIDKLKDGAKIAAGAFLALAAAATAAGIALSQQVGAALKRLDETGDTAARIGLTTEELTKLQYATELTGSHSEDLAGALQHMNKNLSEASTGSGPAADALKQVGLSAESLKHMSAGEAFKAIADGIAQIPNRADQAAASMALFGKSGQSILNTLTAGSGEIERLGNEAVRLGVAFGDLDASKAGAANDALLKMSMVLTGIVNKLTIELAPIITAVGEEFTSWALTSSEAASGVSGAIGGIVEQWDAFADRGSQASNQVDQAVRSVNGQINGLNATASKSSEVVGGAFEFIKTSVESVADAINAVRAIWLGIQGVLTGGIAIVVNAWALFGKAIETVLNVIPGFHVTIGSTLDAIGKDLDKLTKEQLAKSQDLWSKPPSTAIHAWFDKVAEKANKAGQAMSDSAKAMSDEVTPASVELSKKVMELEKNLEAQAHTVGKGNEEMQIEKLRLAGATEGQLAKARALAKVIEEGEKKKKADEKQAEKDKELAKKTYEETRKPLEKYEDKVKDLDKLLASKAITQQTHDRGIVHAGHELHKDLDSKHPEALARGSQAALSAIFHANNRGHENDGIKTVAENTKQQLAEQKKQTRLLKRNVHANQHKDD